MRIVTELRYIDTCCLMMFINNKDSIRKDYGMGSKKAENCVNKSSIPFTIPMPALGEAVFKLREKTGDKWEESMKELDRLIEIGFLQISYLQNPFDLYTMARDLCEQQSDDDRDTISPTDALIVAAAAVDPHCHSMYTTDSAILSILATNEKIGDWRAEQDYGPLKITDPSVVLKY